MPPTVSRASAHKANPKAPPKPTGKVEATRGHVLECALAIVRTEGLAGLTTRHVADVAAVSVGTVFYAFGSLDGLIGAVKEQVLALLHKDLHAAVGDASGAPPAERLLRMADAYMTFAERENPGWAALFEHAPDADPAAMQARTARVFSLLEGILEGLPGLAPEERPVMARALWAGVHGIVYLGRRGSLGPVKGDSIRMTVEALVRATVAGLSTGGGKRQARRPSSR